MPGPIQLSLENTKGLCTVLYWTAPAGRRMVQKKLVNTFLSFPLFQVLIWADVGLSFSGLWDQGKCADSVFQTSSVFSLPRSHRK